MNQDPGFKDDLRKARRGDRDSLGRVLGRVKGRLEAIANARLGDALRGHLRASDILQSTYLEIVRAIDGFSGDTETEFAAWVRQILENNIRDRGKYHAAQKRVPPGEGPETERALAGGRRPPETPSELVALSEDLLQVHRALANLKEDHRRIIVLRIIEGKSFEQAGEALSRTEGATRVLLARARAALLIEIDRLRQEPAH